MNSTQKTEIKIQEEKKIEQVKSHDESIDQAEEIVSFPYRSLLNLRHWRKAPKSLKPFIQALTCLFSISNHDFLTELKINHQLIHNLKSYRPSSIVMDEFRMKYSNLIEISPEYIRTKSFDAYLISIWLHQIDENERLNRIKQTETQLIEQEKK